MEHLSEPELLRRAKLAEFRKLGIDPYPAELFPLNASAKEITEFFKVDGYTLRACSLGCLAVLHLSRIVKCKVDQTGID